MHPNLDNPNFGPLDFVLLISIIKSATVKIFLDYIQVYSSQNKSNINLFCNFFQEKIKESIGKKLII